MIKINKHKREEKVKSETDLEKVKPTRKVL